MTPEEATGLIDQALRKIGNPMPVADGYFLEPRFEAVLWEPTYARDVCGRVWAIELYRGDRVPYATVDSMARIVSIDRNVQPAFFVPEGEPYDQLIPACREQGLALIAKLTDEYETLTFPASSGAGAAQPVARIPAWLIAELTSLANLAPSFAKALRAFSRKYSHLLSSGRATDEAQEDLLEKTFRALLGSDERFSGEYAPLELLRFFERAVPPGRGHEHYFHTFNSFLLGCLVIDRCHSALGQFRRACFPGSREWSVEYVWLLTVIFHDVGYPIQKREQTSELIYGTPLAGYEQGIADRKEAWESPAYRTCRAQLTSLYDHLTSEAIVSDWVPDPFSLQAGHPLDAAFEQSFLKAEGHGVASCMRMLAEFFRRVQKSQKKRQFLARHIFVAGLSIAFHDWPVRKCLRERGISTIRTSCFPFASILMFVDSIQEDRRGTVHSPDILRGICFRDSCAIAQMEPGMLTADMLGEKRREVSDIKSFLQEDLLQFHYPPEFS
jgi:hypothetical protein